jgi:hypothetical protein
MTEFTAVFPEAAVGFRGDTTGGIVTIFACETSTVRLASGGTIGLLLTICLCLSEDHMTFVTG